MRIGTALLAVLIAATVPATRAWAEPAGTSQMQTFANSDGYKGVVKRALAAMPPTVLQRCPALVSNGSRIAILKPVTFAPDGRPNAGAWKQSFPVSGCGNDTILNIYFAAGADEKLAIVLGVPGGSHADIVLQRDALKSARAAAILAMKGTCPEFAIKTTRFEAYGLAKPPKPDPGAGDPQRPWWETWTMVGCGRSIDVPIDFVPDGTGTRIIQPGVAAERQACLVDRNDAQVSIGAMSGSPFCIAR